MNNIITICELPIPFFELHERLRASLHQPARPPGYFVLWIAVFRCESQTPRLSNSRTTGGITPRLWLRSLERQTSNLREEVHLTEPFGVSLRVMPG